jgi:hypothetical protein
MGRWISSILDRIFALLGALLFSQFPFFIQQYTQQLAGHVAELQWQIGALAQLASQSGKSLEQYIQKFSNSIDPDFSLQGHFMQGLVQRFDRLSEGLQALQQATVWERPFIFIQYFHQSIASATYENFKPGLAFTVESAAYLLCGLLVGYLLYQLLCKGLTLILSPLYRLGAP